MVRIAIVHKERCNPQACGGYLCMRVCPVNRQGEGCIVVDPLDKKVKIIEPLCIGCNICVYKCPFDAIKIINLPEALTTKPIHRYGENKFVLYSLPIPQFGKVVGLLGRNGIGKSTALKIFAGQLKPNFGSKEIPDLNEVIKQFRGTEAQGFFEKLRDGNIKVSYKPQHVDSLPVIVKGKVREILIKADERKKLAEVSKALQLENILERDISQLSGGELQRVAIAATALKNATVYILDEPTSYLDIKQRVRMAEFLRTLININININENISVIAVEHDLLILDYMTDAIHILYGQESAYGISSLPKSTREAINNYLEGLLPEENMRFREGTINFQSREHFHKTKPVPLVSWERISKKLGSFTLKAPQGTLNRNEIIGIVGENGIGKTTFVKILANELESDEGTISAKITASYKPQTLFTENDELVITALKDAISKYEIPLMRPLELKHLLNRQLNELSGGELQRVAIAQCLSKDADVYLLDEPSAYLDVEQRLIIAKVIRDIAEQRGCTILVVDHDVMFIHSLADRIMAFDGVPAITGIASSPATIEEGMNLFLKNADITLRRDIKTGRPRINKKGSVLDREQRSAGKWYG